MFPTDKDKEDQTAQVPAVPSVTDATQPLPRSDDGVAQLTTLVGQDAGRLHRIESTGLIGRGTEATIRISSHDVSRRHASLGLNNAGEFYIEDLGSRNGTRVNGVPVRRQVLQPGDKIIVGASTVLLFTRQDGLEDQLLHLQKMESLGQLASGVAHDFNNLLGAVLANTSFLKTLGPETRLGNGDVRESVEDIEMAARRAVDLVKQLLGFARRGKFEELPTSVSRLAEEVAGLVKRTFSEDVELITTIDPDLYVVGDKSQLHQVFINLCINARDAMPSGGRLVIDAEAIESDAADEISRTFLKPGPHVKVMISDTGIGMDAETCRRVFDPFFTTKEQGKGIGLGLAMVYGIVKNHGGHVDVASEQGKGTSFRVYLPQADEGEADPMTEFPRVSTRKEKRKIVLLVDDDASFRSAAERLLKGIGYQVLSAPDGEEGVRLYQKHGEKVDLVLLDMKMPGMDGGATFLQMKKINPRVRVVLCSGEAEEKSVRWLLAAGASGFLSKPFDAEALTRVINKVVIRNRPTIPVKR